MVMKLGMFLCFTFFNAVLALTIHKPHPFSKRLPSKVSINLFKLSCEPRTKDCVWSQSSYSMTCNRTVLAFEAFRAS